MALWLRKLETTVTGGAILIAVASFASRLLGLLRDRLLFSTFGAGDVLDSYYVAFRLPDLIFQILVLGALSSALIPMFIEYDQRGGSNGDRSAWQFVNGVLTILMTGLVMLGALGALFAPQLVPLFAPGFSGAKLHDAILLTRIMLLTLLFFGVSNVLASILNARKRFLAFALAPLLYNVGIIAGIVALYPAFGLAGLAWGVVVGSLFHLLVQLPGAQREGFRFRRRWAWRDAGVRTVFRLMVPRTIGLGASQLDQLVSTIIASTLAAGSIAILNAAQNLQSFPINIFGVSLAISSFPVFSEAFARKETGAFVSAFSKVFRRILFFIVPVTVLMLLLRAHIVRVVLGAGEFDWNDTILTAQSLGFFSLSLFAQSLIPTLTRSFYALKDTVTPMRVSVAMVVLNIAGSVLASRFLGVIGLALSFSVTSGLHLLLLLALLRVRLGDLDDQVILTSTIKIIAGAGLMASSVWLTLRLLAVGVNQATFVGILVQGAGAAFVGIVVYTACALALRFDEVRLIAQWLARARTQLFDRTTKKG